MSFTLKFPENSGFNQSIIDFISGTPDVLKLYGINDTSVKERRLFVTDSTIANLECMKPFVSEFKNQKMSDKDGLIILGPGEKYKTMESVLSIVSLAIEKGFNRSDIFVGIGGGVVCDMTGFAASMFKRGIECEFVPTTLLADVDASIGGKTGCDFSSFKNMIGAFWPARRISIYPDFAKTLPEKEFSSGLSEALKTAFLFNREMCTFLADNKDAVLKRESKDLFYLIENCASAKAAIVNKDFKEKGERAFLNYGHTFGHALESIAGLGEITHGEGVAWGMARALDLSLNLGLCSKEFADAQKKILSDYGYDTKPVPSIMEKDHSFKEKMIGAMSKDKKNQNSNTIRVILQSDWCSTKIVEVKSEDILKVL